MIPGKNCSIDPSRLVDSQISLAGKKEFSIT